MAEKKRRNIDDINNALRPRMRSLAHGVGGVTVVLPPHTHAASQITLDPNSDIGGYLDAFDVQTGMEELDTEKLARSGAQPMLGALDMNHFDVDNVLDLEVEGDVNMTGATGNLNMAGGVGFAILNLVRRITMAGIGLIENVLKIDFTGSGIGDGVIDQPRVIHMAGDDDDNEARIDGLERVVFNDEPSKSVVDYPSVVKFNPNVAPGDQAYTPGQVGWSTLERTLVADVDGFDSSDEVKIALGWTVFQCVDGTAE
jgi:hypothetical protein